MIVAVHNSDNLIMKDINDKVYRARGVIINSNNEILMGYCKDTYQFPGGYVETGETVLEGLKREIKEETGIDVIASLEPFYVIKYFTKDWPEAGINRYTEFNYYLIKTDEKYDLTKTSYDPTELEFNYELRYVKLNELERVLKDTLQLNKKNSKVYQEILDVMKVYFENKEE